MGGQPWWSFPESLPPCSLETVCLGPSSGLLVDWLEMLDPEVVSSCPDLQRRLLFSRKKVTGQPKGRGYFGLPDCMGKDSGVGQ